MWHEVDLPEFQDDSPPGCKKYLSSAICDQQKQFLFEAGEVGETRPRATASSDQRLKFFVHQRVIEANSRKKGSGKKKRLLLLTPKPVLKRHRVPRHFFHNPRIPVIRIAPFLSPRSDAQREAERWCYAGHQAKRNPLSAGHISRT